MASTVLFHLVRDKLGPVDGSVHGIALSNSVNASVIPDKAGVRIENGFIELAHLKKLDELQSFTIEATVEPEQAGQQRRDIVQAESPGIALFIDEQARLVGSVYTADGWKSVDSGSVVLEQNKPSAVRLTRDETGQMELLIDNKTVGASSVSQPIAKAGESGFKIGAGVDGRQNPFIGHIADLQIRAGTMSPQLVEQQAQAAAVIEAGIKAATGLALVFVNLVTDESYTRLQPIRDKMNAAGVERLSDLDTLRINVPTEMTRGRVLVGPRKESSPFGAIDWSAVAAAAKQVFDIGGPVEQRDLLAKYLPNQNSALVLQKLPVTTHPPERTLDRLKVVREMSGRAGRIGTIGRGRRQRGASQEVLKGVAAKSLLDANIRVAALAPTAREVFVEEENVRKLVDFAVIDNLKSLHPTLWPTISPPAPTLYSTVTDVNNAVIIAGVLDLTEQELRIAPDVETLYIIAEKIICGNNAKITWLRPGITTPPRQRDPDLDGRSFEGIMTKPDSRDGLDGEDGLPGTAGLEGAKGTNAPNLEIWVKDMSAVPIIDLSGEDGRQGGKGQPGGSGGNGGDGDYGKYWWCFGYRCWSEAGDGGNGGNGGNGGAGGQGGNGGHGGTISINVLEGTLAATVEAKEFKLQNKGGQLGRGGAGGQGGNGGLGGRSGSGEHCKADDGVNGAKGQPGPAGADGRKPGTDGWNNFEEFTQEAWDAQLTRPWLSDVIPSQIFPGDQLILRGTQFIASDDVVLDGNTVPHNANTDGSLSVTVPIPISGGQKSIFVRRVDGQTVSNSQTIWVKPQLDTFVGLLHEGDQVALTGHAFLNGASVLIDGAANPANWKSATELDFKMPGTGGHGSAGGITTLQVRNPDGMVSNAQSAVKPRILEVPFKFGQHNLSFVNPACGVPDWSTYEDTFGTAEVWHELLDPVFGHPVLTTAFFRFYEYFLKGEKCDGLATGFCTAMSSIVVDRFWQGYTDTPTITLPAVHKLLTAVHGKLLSKETLLRLHDQGREGEARVEKTYREIEGTFLRGCDRNNAPLLFFIPSGDIWDAGYFDKLGKSHCVMPIRFNYPEGHPGPSLTPDKSSTSTDPNGVELQVWDCNLPESKNCRLVFRRNQDHFDFDFFEDGSKTFSSQDGITLGLMTNGQYYLADHDLPFGGLFGALTFIIDFLLSPADLQITNEAGLHTGVIDSKIYSEIPGSAPCYLVKGAYLLPRSVPLTRTIVGTADGRYSFNSISPDGVSLTIENVETSAGQKDELAINADYTQLRFTPGSEKTCTFTLARQVGDYVRAVAVEGIGGGPDAAVDVTTSPEMSLVRVGNQSGDKTVSVRAFTIDKKSKIPLNNKVEGFSLPGSADLLVAVSDWTKVTLDVKAVGFK